MDVLLLVRADTSICTRYVTNRLYFTVTYRPHLAVTDQANFIVT